MLVFAVVSACNRISTAKFGFNKLSSTGKIILA
jgi:hypothetical protein